MTCLVAAALTEIGDAWSLRILRSALLGRTRFAQFREDISISRGRLSDRLEHLVAHGLLRAELYSTNRSEYRLTEKALDLYPAIMLLRAWGEKWLRAHRPPAQALIHRCGAALAAKAVCGHCHRKIEAPDCEYSSGTGAIEISKLDLRSTRRSSSANATGKMAESPSANALALIGDRWTFVILRAMFFGASRFDKIQEEIGIARNILASRLNVSAANGLISRALYQSRPSRYEYKLTEKGKDLYGSIISLITWANVWIVKRSQDTVKLRHLPCRHQLKLRVVCSSCGEQISPHEVTVKPLDAVHDRPKRILKPSAQRATKRHKAVVSTKKSRPPRAV